MRPDRLFARLRSHSTGQFGVGASDAEIAAAQERLGLSFPQSYAEFLAQFGWGGVEDIELFGLGAEAPPHLDLVSVTLSEREEMEPALPHGLLPIRNDGGGNLFCLDTARRRDGEAPVVFWDHELPSSQEPEVVAPTFATWLSEELDAREV